MYDWITASYNIEGHNHKDYTNKMVRLSEVKTFWTGTTWTNGYIWNSETGRKMGLSVSDKRIKLSLSNKFIVGNNVQDAPVNLVYSTLYDLSNVLGLDLGLFTLEELDVTHTAYTDYIPEMYFPYLCNQKTFLRYGMGTSLYYEANSSKVKKVFYDKVKEVDKRKTWGKRQTIPSHLKGKNLTRFECRLGTNKEIRNVIGHKGVLGQIFTEEHIDQLQNWWLNQYHSIPKTTDINYKFTNNMGAKQVKKTIMNLALMKLGRLEVEGLIDLADKQGAFKQRNEKQRVKNDLLGGYKTSGKKHNLIKELDEKLNKTEPVMD